MTTVSIPHGPPSDPSMDASTVLDLLGRVGQDITASLDFADIFAAIERHVGDLLDTATLYIGIIDASGEWIDIPLFVDGGRRAASRRLRVDDPVRPASRCVREDREILREKTIEEAQRTDIPGTIPTLTALFRPLKVQGRTIGVMSVQSGRAHAYGERERLIFRSLCFSTAVAIANAESHRRLVALQTLEALGAIGQEITASLVPDHVFAAIARHVPGLFGTDLFVIARSAPDAEELDVLLFAGRGQPDQIRSVRRLGSLSMMATVVAEGTERLFDYLSDEAAAAAWPGEPRALATTLAGPLTVGHRMLGAMAVQSHAPRAFSPQQILAFRTLCASVAIAVANAEAYAQEQSARAAATEALIRLRRAQDSLVEAEKLAGLGRLVAGMAHEVNTPLGTALTVASSLDERLRLFRAQAASGLLKRSELIGFLDMAGEAMTLVGGNLRRAGDLIARFKDLASDRTRDQRRPFALADLVTALLSTLEHDLEARGLEVMVAIAPDLTLVTYPGALGEVLGHILANACLHAFPSPGGGRISIAAAREGDRIVIRVADNGVGLAPDLRMRLFEPFATPRRSGAGPGLGLHLAFTLCTQVLQGRLACTCPPEGGTLFTIDLPASAEAEDHHPGSV